MEILDITFIKKYKNLLTKLIVLSFNHKIFLKIVIKPHYLRPVWYMYLKIKNCCLKIFIKISIGKKVYKNT